MQAARPNRRPTSLTGDRHITIVDDGHGVGLALAGVLRDEGLEVLLVSSGANVEPTTDGVIYLRALRDYAAIDEAADVNHDALVAARAVASKFTSDGGFFCTVQDTGGRFALDEWCEPAKAVVGGLAGLTKTAAQEWPKATVRAIDFDAGHRAVSIIAQEIADELLEGGDDLEIGLPEGERIRIEMVEASVSRAANPPLGQGDVVVVSGGARGVTAACIIELGRRTGARFVLLGRTPLADRDQLEDLDDDAELKRALLERAKAAGDMPSPRDLQRQAGRLRANREIRGTIQALAAVGSEGRYVAADVRDVNQLYDAFDRVREEWGPIRGLVHGAGVIEDRRLEDKTDEQFEKVFGTKVAGYWALCAATAQDPIRVLCLFSSVAGRAGNVGQADYAMANEVLNKSAQIESRRREDCVVKSIGWGPWDGGMVGPELRQVFEERGVELIGIEHGANIFADEVLGDSDAVELVVGSLLETAQPQTSSGPDEDQNKIERTFRLDAQSHPFLLDHVIDGIPVMPLVVALEMFIDVCSEWYDPSTLSLNDVRVKHGVRLRSLDEGETISIGATRTANGVDQATLELRDAEGTLCYTATAVGHQPAPEERVAAPGGTDEPYRGVVYDGELLFHGPSLRVLQDVTSPGETGMTAVTLTSTGAGWETPHRSADPAALDAAMQLAVLWTSQRIDGLSLPLGVSGFRVLKPFDDGQLTAVLHERSSSRSRTLTDIDLVDSAGDLVAMLRGVEVYKYRRRS